ncbi:MAG: serine hydrolase domain-containing protein [Aurantibacter sp.]
MKYFVIILVLASNLISAQKFKVLEELLDNELRSTEPGGIVLIKKGGDILFQKAIGLADLQTQKAITDSTIFNTGSISKTFVAYGILILESEGKLSIEDSIVNYFPDFTNKHLSAKIKIKHLLSHTSGIPDIRKVQDNPSFYLTAKDRENFEPIKAVKRLNFEPGAEFEYSNPAFNGLALIIEQVAKEPWQDFIRKKIFEPSGMTQSTITNGEQPEDGVAHGYETSNGAFKENDYGEFPTFAAAGNGGVWCSILDLVKYEEAIRNSIFLEAEAIHKSREIYLPENWNSDSSARLGFSWFISPREDNKYQVKTISHTGSQGGFRSFLYSVPEKEVVFVALFNRPITNMSQIVEEGFRVLQNNNWLDME